MERVTGMGGIFWRARDPEALGRWYAECLGVAPPPGASDQPWWADAGPVVFAPFAADTDYFAGPHQTWMPNFRVRDLDAMLAQLRELGADVEAKVEDYDYGRFGWVRDPEGNRVELWEPSAGSLEPPPGA
jgi:hypothetical protein